SSSLSQPVSWIIPFGTDPTFASAGAPNNALGSIEPQHTCGHLAHRRERLDDRTVQFEVLVPRVSPGIEEPDRATGTVDGCDIRAFVPIAEDTGVGQIAYTRGAAVFAADDVIDLMRKARAIRPDSIRNVDAHARSRAGARRRLHHEALARICRARAL